MSTVPEAITKEYAEFLDNLKSRIVTSRYEAARAVNKEMILLYYYIGMQILLTQKEYGWGSKVIDKLSKDMISAFPEMKGFSTANLYNMRRFAELYHDTEILQQVAGELPWYHHVILMERVKEPAVRLFYMQEAIKYGWSRTVLVHQIELKLYERQGKVTHSVMPGLIRDLMPHEIPIFMGTTSSFLSQYR